MAGPPGQRLPEGGRHLLGACGFLAPYPHSLDPQVPLGDAVWPSAMFCSALARSARSFSRRGRAFFGGPFMPHDVDQSRWPARLMDGGFCKRET